MYYQSKHISLFLLSLKYNIQNEKWNFYLYSCSYILIQITFGNTSLLNICNCLGKAWNSFKIDALLQETYMPQHSHTIFLSQFLWLIPLHMRGGGIKSYALWNDGIASKGANRTLQDLFELLQNLFFEIEIWYVFYQSIISPGCKKIL